MGRLKQMLVPSGHLRALPQSAESPRDASSSADISHTWLPAGAQGEQYLCCLTYLLCFRGQVLPAASLLNIVDVELIYEGVKYILQVRAGLCSSRTSCSTSHEDRGMRFCPEGGRCNKYEVAL